MSEAGGWPDDGSLLSALMRGSDDQVREALEGWSEDEVVRGVTAWGTTSRSTQQPPEEPWSTWLIMAGRGFGKTRTGAEWVNHFACSWPGARIALIGPTHHDVRAVMVEGDSGVLNVGEGRKRPTFEPSRRRLRWDNGAWAMLFSAEEPDSPRGYHLNGAWGDEIALWPDGPALWMNLRLAMRKRGGRQTVLTTTPKPVPLLRALLADAGVVKTLGRTTDNAAHLPPDYIAAMKDAYGGTRLGRQELDGELIDDVEGALWTRNLIERGRVRSAPELRRVVVGVDPPASSGENADACGIVVAALGADGRAYVLADASVRSREPNGWAAAVVQACHGFGADRVVAEANNGGDMVEGVLKAVDAGLPVKLVRASRGKSARAEPVAALYTAGKASHAGAFPELEDEMCAMVVGGGYEGPGRAPDRADALVGALTELMLGRRHAVPRAWVG